MVRKKWKYADKAREFQAAHGHARYAMDFIATLETEMLDPRLDSVHRVWSAIKRFSWGNLSDVAVDALPKLDPDDPLPRLISQASLADRIELSPSVVSDACVVLRNGSYLREGGDGLYPDDQQAGPLFGSAGLRGSSDNSPLDSTKQPGADSDSDDNDSPFLRFKETFLADHPALSDQITLYRTERDRLYTEARALSERLRALDRKVLGAWRDFQRTATTSGAGPEPAERDSHSDDMPAKAADDSNLTTFGVDSDSTVGLSLESRQEIRTPTIGIRTPATTAVPKPNGINESTEPLLNLEALSRSGTVGRSVEPAPETPETYLPTPAQIRALPEMQRVAAKLEDTPGDNLCQPIAVALRGAPLDRLEKRIKLRFHAITSFGMVEGLAEDVGKVWEREENARRAAEPPPPGPVCPKCSGTGFLGGLEWEGAADARAHLAAGGEICTCEHGKVVREFIVAFSVGGGA